MIIAVLRRFLCHSDAYLGLPLRLTSGLRDIGGSRV